MSSRTVQAHALFHQDRRRHRALLAEDAEQQVLGADVVVQQPVGFLGGELQDALGLGAERDVDRRRHLLPEHGPAFDFLADALERRCDRAKIRLVRPLPFADQPEQQVLGLDGIAAELAGLVAGEEENPPGSFRVPFEHPDTATVRGLTAVYRWRTMLLSYTATRHAPDRVRPASIRLDPTDEGWRAARRSRPPSRRSTRSQHAARRGLCVAMTEVSRIRGASRAAARAARRRSVSSRSPVGSSASSSAGLADERARDRRPAAVRRPTACPADAEPIGEPDAPSSPRRAAAALSASSRGRSRSGISVFSSASNRAAGDGTERRTRRAGSGTPHVCVGQLVDARSRRSERARRRTRSRPPSTCSSVLLPTPEAPTIATISPASTSRSRPRKHCRVCGPVRSDLRECPAGLTKRHGVYPNRSASAGIHPAGLPRRIDRRDKHDHDRRRDDDGEIEGLQTRTARKRSGTRRR